MNASDRGPGMPAERRPAAEWSAPSLRDDLREWMERTPWLAVSLAAHLAAFFVLAVIPWKELREPPGVVFTMQPVDPPERLVDPPVPPIMDDPDVELPPDPELQTADTEPVDTTADDAVDDAVDDDAPHSPFDAMAERESFPAVLGVGASPFGGKYGDRGARGPGDGKRGRAIERSLEAGLTWLAAHQSPEGHWDADGFDAHCGDLGSGRCDGAGYAEHDVGVTALALLAFLGSGSSTAQGLHRAAVQRGVAWLVAQQDPDSGLVGARTSKEFLYDHALATLALCESYVLSGGSPLQKRYARRAIDYVLATQNPYSGWRYDAPPTGDSDTSVTGWMVFALTAARDAGLEVPRSAFDGALAWLDEATDPATGRVGYRNPGSRSSRVVGVNDHFPADSGEALTAVGLLSRVFIEGTETRRDLTDRQAELMARALPGHGPDAPGGDMYYWYYGTYAMFQVGGRRADLWERWEEALVPVLLDSQRVDGDTAGSWDPAGPWGPVGGRVYSTALMTLCLEVHFRYGRLLGGR